jgi:hypothetical protein
MLSGKQFLVESENDYFLEDQYHNKIKNMETVIALISFLSIINAVAFYEFSYDGGYDTFQKDYSLYAYICTVLTVLLMFSIIIYEKILLKMKQSLQIVAKYETLYSTGRYWVFFYYFLLIIVHPNPAFIGMYYSSYNVYIDAEVPRSLNSIFCIFILLRFYFVFRCFMVNSVFMTPDSNKICREFYFEANIFYSIRSFIKGQPIKIYAISMLIFIFFFSFAIRIFERGYLNKLELIITDFLMQFGIFL